MSESIDRKEAEKRLSADGFVPYAPLLDILFPPEPREFYLCGGWVCRNCTRGDRKTCTRKLKVREVIE